MRVPLTSLRQVLLLMIAGGVFHGVNLFGLVWLAVGAIVVVCTEFHNSAHVRGGVGGHDSWVEVMRRMRHSNSEFC